MKQPLDALKSLGEAISASLIRKPAKVIAKIAKKIEQSPVTIRNIDLTRDYQKFISDIKDEFCTVFKRHVPSSIFDEQSAINEFKVVNNFFKLGSTELFGIRNTLLTNQPETALPALRPEFFTGKGRAIVWSKEGIRNVRKSSKAKKLIRNWPFAARKISSAAVAIQIYELLVIWARNKCELEVVREKVVQFRKNESENYNRQCNILIFGRGTAISFATKVEIDEGEVDTEKLEEEAMEEAIKNAETSISVFETSDNWQLRKDPSTGEMIGWIGVQPGAWLGPEVVQEFEHDSNIDWFWKIEVTCAGDYCYQETDIKGAQIGCD